MIGMKQQVFNPYLPSWEYIPDAKKAIVQECEKYKSQLEKSGAKYKILSEKTNEDGSIVIEIKKQYNSSPVGKYLN